MRRALWALPVLALTGCCTSGGHLLGATFPEKGVTTVGYARTATSPLVVQGTMVEKCPVSGCWFRMKDATGPLKVDLKSAGVTVADVPLGVTVTVAGKRDPKADEPTLVATGLRW